MVSETDLFRLLA